MSQCLIAELCLIAVSSAIHRLRPLPCCLLQQAACRSVHTSRHVTAMSPQNVHSICKGSCAITLDVTLHVTVPGCCSVSDCCVICNCLTSTSAFLSSVAGSMQVSTHFASYHGNVATKCAQHLQGQLCHRTALDVTLDVTVPDC